VRHRRAAWVAGGAAIASAALLVAPALAAQLTFSRSVPIKPRRGAAALRSWGGAACPSLRLCVATDGTPRVLTSTNPTGGRRAWTFAPIGNDGYISSLTCASTALCVAGGSDQLITGFYVSTNPAAGAAAWTFEGPVSAQVISGVSCPSVALCVAVDEGGHVLTSGAPAAGAAAWSVGTIDRRADFSRVSCPSVNLCVAVDQGGAIYSSKDPAAGPSSWHRTRRRGFHGWFDVNCPTVHLCIAAGSGMAISTRPARAGSWRWIPEPPNRDHIKGITGISCAGPRLCVGADIMGLVFVSTHPSGGVRSWRVVRVHGSRGTHANVRVGCARARRRVCVVAATVGEWFVVGRVPRRHRR
jgi:hypothetical protein